MSFLERVLAPVAEVRREEGIGVVLMFAYSFLAMSAYNIVRPVTRSKYISDLGADNLPYVMLAAGLIIGVLMSGYSWLVSRLPRNSALPITQVGMAVLLVVFWGLFQADARWASAGFYLMGLILGILLISQFWTVANLVYDPRQAKRVFGFIGAGAPLGGMAGSYLLQSLIPRIGTTNVLLISAGMLLVSAALVWRILRINDVPVAATATVPAAAVNEKGVSSAEAFALLRGSRHLKIIALVISFAAVGGTFIEQQLNMAAEAAKGADKTDAITVFLAQVQLWTSGIGFIIQIWLTSRIHRFLGIGFALMVLPVSLGASAVVMLLNAALWAPGLARVLDQSLRYTIDKTTREILFLPLPGDVKLKAKSFVDVTVDRMAKAFGALLLLILVQPWGLDLDWQQLSYASLAMVGLWIAMSAVARRGYLEAFRQSLNRRDVVPAEVRLTGADLSTVETLLQEFAHPQPARVVYAIDMLEALGKGTLVTPLLLNHESAQVRERALRAIAATHGDYAVRWTPHVRRALADPDAAVRAASLVALAAIAREDAPQLARPMLEDPDPRIRATAAIALASGAEAADVDAAEAMLAALVADTSDTARPARQDIADALVRLGGTRFQHLLIPLLYDPSTAVADRAMASVQKLGTTDFLFVPTLVSLLRNRHLKGRARAVLVSYGEPVVPALAWFLADPLEDAWVRRHVPTTLALIPSQASVDALLAHLTDPDGFVRYKVTYALTRLHSADDRLRIPADVVERAIVKEGRQFFRYLSLQFNLTSSGHLPAGTLLAQALRQKTRRTQSRMFQLLGLIFPYDDIRAAEWTLTQGDARTRASASEYLDNLLSGQVRRFVVPVVEDLPPEERVRRGNILLGSRRRSVEETLLELMNDDDEVMAACAIDVIREQRQWNLASDLEHALAHRDARDWFVFEAASWALAEQRLLAERRRQAWLEPVPTVVLASRLRALPLFDALSVDDLFRIAAASRQVRHEPGTVLFTARIVPAMLHVLLDGEVSVTGERNGVHSVSAPATLAFWEALLSRPMTSGMRTTDFAVTLALTSEELRTQLAYNATLVRGLFASMPTWRPEASHSQVQSTGAARALAQLTGNGVRPVEKVLALEHVPLFAHLSAEEALHLAGITRTVRMTEAQVLFRGIDRPALWLLLSGEVRLPATQTQAAATAVGGDTIGSFSTLAGPRIGADATVIRSGVALCIDRDDLFELLGDRPEMLRQLFAGVMEMAADA